MRNLDSLLCILSLAGLLIFGTNARAQTLDFSSDDNLRTSISAALDRKTDEEKKTFSEALLRVVLSRHPKTKGLTGFARLSAMAELGSELFKTGGEALDDITVETIEAEIAAFKAGEAQSSVKVGNLAGIAEEALNCLNSRVILTNPRFEDRDGSWFYVDVTNNLNWAIRAYNFSYTIIGDDRSVPVKEGQGGSEISGGIEPGETKTISVWAGANISPYEKTEITVSIQNLFDAKKRRFVEDGPNFLGYPSEPSPNMCERY